jgi:hypothetical protein
MSTRIEVEWPDDPGFGALGRLVLGGVAARAALPVDRVDELGLALDTLTRGGVAGGHLHLWIDLTDEALTATIGVFESDPLAEPGVKRVVHALADDVDSEAAHSGYRIALTIATGPRVAA